MSLLAVDPGKRACGVAVFAEGELRRAAWVKGPATGEGPQQWREMAQSVFDWKGYPLPEAVAIEVPQAYPSDTADRTMKLQDLVAIAAWIFALYPGARHVLRRPREWKGTIDGDACVERVKARLSPEEKARVVLPSKSRAHNTWDSVGLGLFETGRFGQRRVISRG